MLIDRFLPRYDFALAHAVVLPASSEECWAAARRVDFLRHPVFRVLLAGRALPLRVAEVVTRAQRASGTAAEALHAFRLFDMPRLGFVLLGEEPGVEVVYGQVSRPWQAAASEGPPIDPAGFTEFRTPGFAKIVFSLSVISRGGGSSILVVETRVALTDDDSSRRFRRYWRVIRPFSDVLRRIVLRMIAAEVRRSRAD
ncbi:MAG TPA: hypothetical protein VF097_02680 [Actinomycetota bacterium]